MKFFSSQIFRAITIAIALAFALSVVAEHIGALPTLALYVGANFAAASYLGVFSPACRITAIELAKLNAADDMAGLIEENQNVAPELNIVPAFTIKGTSFTTLIRKTYPSGSFKKRGGGVAIGETTFENKLVQCFPYENPLRETVDLARAHRRGEAAFLALVESGALKGAFELIGKTLYYGARAFGGGADAHPGLIDMYDATNMVVDAGGTTADTASSAWFIKWGNQEDGNVSYVFGQDRVLDFNGWLKQLVEVTTGKQALCNINSLMADVGVQFSNVRAVCRVKKLTEDVGKGMTDTLGYKAYEKFPQNMRPDVCLMTKRSVRQLRESRAAVGAIPVDAVPWPTSVAGIPITETDSISNTEALAL